MLKGQSTARAAEPAFPTLGISGALPGLGMQLIWIRPGTFTLGTADGDLNDPPTRTVTIARGFWIGATEVTQGQWGAIMGSLPSAHKGLDLPVEQVSWNRAMEFCRRLTEREHDAGRLPAGYVYTLPSEEEWEYACRAGTTAEYAGSLDAMAWYAANSGGQSHPVGQIQSNNWLLHDMHGNVWEWTRDRYVNFQEFNAIVPGAGIYRVLRGGSWANDADALRSANRAYNSEDTISPRIGLRVVLSPEG